MRSKRTTIAVIAAVALLAGVGVFAFTGRGPDRSADVTPYAEATTGVADADGGADVATRDTGSADATGGNTNAANATDAANDGAEDHLLAAKDDSAATGGSVTDGGDGNADANDPVPDGSGDADKTGEGPADDPNANNGPNQSGVNDPSISNNNTQAAGPKPTDGTNSQPNSETKPNDGTDPYAGDPGGDPANGGTVSDGVPSQPHSPVTVPDDGSGDPEAHTADVDLPALFAPVTKESDPGADASGLPAFLAETDPAFMRDETDEGYRLIGYDAGDVYEIKNLDAGVLVTITYRYPTGQTSRRGDLVYDESKERPRVFAVLEYLFPEQAEAVRNDFTAMRHWQESYLRAYGLSEIDWAAFVRSRYYGTRYCLMSVSRDTVTVTVYPAGYRDEMGDFAANGSYREFYTYPLNR